MAPSALLSRIGATVALLVVLLAPAATNAAPTRYVISAKDSRFTYSMEHPMHSWSGTSREVEGEVALDPQLPSATVGLALPVLSFDSGNGNRDSHMAEVVESYIYADVGFHSTEAHLDSTAATPDGGTRSAWTVKGTLSFHGVDRPLECPVQVTLQGDRMLARGSFAIKLTEFGLELPALLGIRVKDAIQLVFDVTALHQDEPDNKAGKP